MLNTPHEKRSGLAFNKDNLFDLYFSKTRNADVYAPKYLPATLCNPVLQDKFVRSEITKEYYCPNEFSFIEDKFETADDKIVKSVADEQGGFQLLKLIKSVPKLKFKLTPEQELMISTP